MGVHPSLPPSHSLLSSHPPSSSLKPLLTILPEFDRFHVPDPNVTPSLVPLLPPFMDLSQVHHFFQMFDHDGDGKITKQELSKSLQNLGINIPDNDLQHMIDHIDTNGDGTVSLEEFEELYQTIISEERDEEEDIREAFKVFDKNGDGFITVEELSSVLASLGLRQDRTIQDCQLMVNKVDEDGDGMVNYSEFRQMMKCGNFAALGTS